MANFNVRNQNKGKNGFNETTNHEGATVHQLNALETLFSKVLGSFFGESSYYENRSSYDDFNALLSLMEQVQENDKEYALKIAELGRLSNMIQYPLEILTVAYNMERYKGENFLDDKRRNKLRYYTNSVVRRTKDINEILATQLAVYGRKKPLPMQMRKNLKWKIEQYDQYKLSKGLDTSNEVKLSDAIKMLRPKPKTKEMEQFYRDIIEDNVSLGNDKKQIQTELTRLGQQRGDRNTGDLKDSLYKANLQALLKHLVNLIKNDVFEDPQALKYAVDKIRDKNTVLASKLLPFRFLSAYKELERFGNNRVVVMLKEAVEDALDISVENVDNIDGLTAFLIDRSGSMRYSRISEHSSVTAEDIALILGAIAYKKGTGDLFVFGSDTKRVNVSRRTPILEIVRAMKQHDDIGAGTDLNRALEFVNSHAKNNSLEYDNLIILSDNDCYGYNENYGVLTFGERYGWTFARNSDSADKQVSQMIRDGVIKKVWINNLAGNDFAIVNTNAHTKNLITGFSEKFINIINIYNYLGTGKDIRKVIDLLLEKEQKAK